MNAIQQIIGWMPALLQATGVTLALSVTSVLTALVLAVFLALGKISKNTVLRSVCGAYIFFFRGTPLLMQLFFLYYTLPQLVPAFNIQSRFLAAWIAFSLNVAAYLAEIIRAAIQSIDKGQLEASTALGLTHSQAMRLVIIPQAYRRMIPPICNEFAQLREHRHQAVEKELRIRVVLFVLLAALLRGLHELAALRALHELKKVVRDALRVLHGVFTFIEQPHGKLTPVARLLRGLHRRAAQHKAPLLRLIEKAVGHFARRKHYAAAVVGLQRHSFAKALLI